MTIHLPDSGLSEYPTLGITPAPPRSRLKLGRCINGVQFYFVTPRPNGWYRFWQRVVFGFVWEELP